MSEAATLTERTARVARLAGALILEADGAYFFVGQTKEPCDWKAHGFVPPAERDAVQVPWVRLGVLGAETPRLLGLTLTLATELGGEALAGLLARRFLIERNGSVSDRLWRLVVVPDGELDPPDQGTLAARFLVEVPDAVWRVVRESVLKCL